jgi:hypothetical protein
MRLVTLGRQMVLTSLHGKVLVRANCHTVPTPYATILVKESSLDTISVNFSKG